MEGTPSLKTAAESLWQPLPEQRDCCPELSLDEAAGPRLNFLGRKTWLGGGTAAFSMVLCGCLSTHSTTIPAASVVQGIPPAPGLCLPSWVPVQKTPVQENQSNEQTFRADPECLWLVD